MDSNKSRKRIAKWTLIGGLTLATLVGTFSLHKNDFPPFYTEKAGIGYGISVGFVSNPEENSEFYGGSFAFSHAGGGEFNGLEFGVVNGSGKNKFRQINGVQVGFINLEGFNKGSMEVNGLQIGLFNKQTGGDVFQVGIYNSSTKNGDTRKSFLLNYDFR